MGKTSSRKSMRARKARRNSISRKGGTKRRTNRTRRMNKRRTNQTRRINRNKEKRNRRNRRNRNRRRGGGSSGELEPHVGTRVIVHGPRGGPGTIASIDVNDHHFYNVTFEDGTILNDQERFINFDTVDGSHSYPLENGTKVIMSRSQTGTSGEVGDVTLSDSTKYGVQEYNVNLDNGKKAEFLQRHGFTVKPLTNRTPTPQLAISWGT